MGDSKSMLDAALRYADMGWRVFPLRPKRKTPLIKEWGVKASKSAEQIRYWWTKWPDANIAVLTGKKSGLFVVDIDPKNGGDESITILLNSHNHFPETATQRTGSGGSHVLFTYPDKPIKTRRGFPAVGIDICSDGGYIVAAPSVHPNGNTYQWTIQPESLNPPPEWLIRLLQKGDKKPIQHDGVIKEGIRNVQLFSLGCSLRSKGMSKKDFGMELHKINQYQCEPPLPDDEVNRIIDRVNLQLNQEKSPLFRFRDYIRSDQFPKDSHLRHILHAISFYMDENGNRCFPTEEQIANDTGLARETVVRRLKIAVDKNYILRQKHKQEGQKYPNYVYFLPRRFMNTRKPCDSQQA